MAVIQTAANTTVLNQNNVRRPRRCSRLEDVVFQHLLHRRINAQKVGRRLASQCLLDRLAVFRVAGMFHNFRATDVVFYPGEYMGLRADKPRGASRFLDGQL